MNKSKHVSIIIEDTPLLIADTKIDEILTLYDSYQAGISIPLFTYEPPQMTIDNGVAVIPIHGVLSQRLNILQQIFGGVSTEDIQSLLDDALSSMFVREVVLDIDSPGGGVDGIASLAESIHNARSIKPITAYVNSTALSAAYWIASATNKIILSSLTSQVGSIGVVAIHRDISKAEEKAGIKTTEITAGKYKRIASRYAPLNEEGISEIQSQVNYIYQIFVDAVARYRGVRRDTVLNKMADGKIFIGKQAIDAGLADEIRTIANKNKGGANMSTITTDMPDVDSIKAEAYQQGFSAGVEKGITEGIEKERARVMAILEMKIDGYEAQIDEAIKSGVTAEQTAITILKLQKERGITMAQVKDGAVMAQFVGETQTEKNPLIEDIKRRFK